MVELIVMCGISASGKSYYANRFCKDFDIVSSDGIREELYGDASIQRNPKRVFEIAHSRIEANIAAGIDTVFDATNLTRKIRQDIINRYKGRAHLVCLVTPFDASRAIYNQMLRNRKVPESVILRQANQYESPTIDEGWDKIISIGVNENEPCGQR